MSESETSRMDLHARIDRLEAENRALRELERAVRILFRVPDATFRGMCDRLELLRMELAALDAWRKGREGK